jgi:hypothetical protein
LLIGEEKPIKCATKKIGTLEVATVGMLINYFGDGKF